LPREELGKLGSDRELDGDEELNEQPSDMTRRRRTLVLAALALVALALVVGLLIGRKPKVEVAESESAPAEPAEVASAPLSGERRAPAPVAQPAKRKPRPLEYMSDGVPIMPVSSADEQPTGFAHPHPITSAHLRIYRENNLLYQLNEAMDGREVVRLRALLAVYREEYPEDPHEMQQGYELIADCIANPSDEVRARATRYFKEEIASTLRRFVLRHCLDGNIPP
jgi:hypothetical protein